MNGIPQRYRFVGGPLGGKDIHMCFCGRYYYEEPPDIGVFGTYPLSVRRNRPHVYDAVEVYCDDGYDAEYPLWVFVHRNHRLCLETIKMYGFKYVHEDFLSPSSVSGG